jgi:hypothetical protein
VVHISVSFARMYIRRSRRKNAQLAAATKDTTAPKEPVSGDDSYEDNRVSNESAGVASLNNKMHRWTGYTLSLMYFSHLFATRIKAMIGNPDIFVSDCTSELTYLQPSVTPMWLTYLS